MELFKISCVTCQASLSVRNQSLIGQIVSCPRCGSMVEIAAPAEAPAQPVAEVPSTPEPAPAPTPTVASFAPTETPPAETPGATPAPSWFAKYQLLIGAIGSIAVGVAILGATFLSGKEQSVATNSVADTQQPTNPEPLTSSAPTTDEAPPVQLAAEQPTEDLISEAAPPAEPIVKQPPTQPQIPEVEEVVTTPEVENEVSDESAALAKLAQAQEPPLKRKFNSLDLDLEDLDLTSIGTEQPPARIARMKTKPSPPPREAPLEIPPASDIVRLSPDALTSPIEVDLVASLQQTYPSLKFENLPLIHFLRMMSELSGVPVSIAPEDLVMAGISARKKVSLNAQDISPETALQQVLAPLNLVHVVQDGQIQIVRRDASKLREISYPISDLITPDTDSAWLQQCLVELIAPASWSANGGQRSLEITPDAIRVQQIQRVHYQILILLERLRLARQLPQESRYPVDQLFDQSPWVISADTLGASTTFTFSRYTPIRKVFSYWESQLRLPLLIDWPSLAEKQLWPQTEITCSVSEEPWHASLDKVLAPLGLGWRMVPGRSIQITTAEVIESEPQLELFPIKGDYAALEQKVRSASHPEAVLLYDPVGQVLLSRQPAAAQRRLAQTLLELQ